MAATKSRPWGKVKPPAGSTVNWGDPINRGLVSRMLFAESNGFVTRDIVHWKTSEIGATVTRRARVNSQMLTFQGTGHVSLDDRVLGIASGFTVSIWFITAIGGNVRLLYCADEVGTRNIQFRLETTSSVGLIRFNAANSVVSNFATSGTYADNALHHAVAIFDANVGSAIYIDGVLKNSDTVLTAQSDRTGSYPALGSRGSARSDAMNGQLDNFSFYNRPLNASEIKRLYTEPFAGITEPRIRIRSGAAPPPATKKYSLFNPVVLRAAR